MSDLRNAKLEQRERNKAERQRKRLERREAASKVRKAEANSQLASHLNRSESSKPLTGLGAPAFSHKEDAR
jgi:hypothetical protein